MNKGEASDVGLLLRWIKGSIPTSWNITDQHVLQAAQRLADRAYKELSTGLRADDVALGWPDEAPWKVAAELRRTRISLADITADRDRLLRQAAAAGPDGLRALDEATARAERAEAELADANRQLAEALARQPAAAGGGESR